jgi:hypothetical protein
MPPPKPSPYAIYPAVGIARLGSTPVFQSFFGPDVPNEEFVPSNPLPGGRYRDHDDNIRRQGVRFRVYRIKWQLYKKKGWIPRSAKEVNADDGLTLSWTVTVANFKAFKSPGTPTSKSSRDRIRNGRSKTISGVNQPTIDLRGDAVFPSSTFPSGATSADLLLGQIFTDEKGRLVFFAGMGESRNVGGVIAASDPGFSLFNRGWFDDICDGSIECEVRAAAGAPQAAERAWVVTGAPAFAHQIGHLVTLYDVAETIAISRQRLPRPRRPSVTRHIAPVLRITDRQRWVTDYPLKPPPENGEFQAPHEVPFDPEDLLKGPSPLGPMSRQDHKSRRHEIVKRLRNPITVHASDRKNPFLPHWYPVVGGSVVNDPGVALGRALTAPQPRDMPRQIGLPFTLEQWKRFRQWDDGAVDWDFPSTVPVPAMLEDITDPLAQIDALNRAHMGSMVGGSTMPGIEVGWMALETRSWGNAFRPAASLEPGDFTFSLSVPWPADFFACAFQDVTHAGKTFRNDWWPAARPIAVRPSGSAPGVFRVPWSRGVSVRTNGPDWWKTRGFIRKNPAGTGYEEEEKL